MMGEADDEILVARDGAVATITFNRPERLNAFRRSTYQRLHAVIADLEQESGLRVVILTGSGKGFCAGEDLHELEASAARGMPESEMVALVQTLQDITRRIVNSHHVYIAAVNGVAAGFGAEVAIACDLRIVADGARFLFPEVRRGLFVTNGVSVLLQRLVGQGRAKEWLLTGAPVDAAAAAASGLANDVVAPGALLTRAAAMAAAIVENAALSVRLTKRIVNETADGDLERALTAEVGYVIECFRAGAHEEGARAFVEKRAAQFSRDGGSPR